MVPCEIDERYFEPLMVALRGAYIEVRVAGQPGRRTDGPLPSPMIAGTLTEVVNGRATLSLVGATVNGAEPTELTFSLANVTRLRVP